MSLLEATICDRNKSERTEAITRAAFAYLQERGFKPVETEVSLCQRWVADVAAVAEPTPTEMIKLKLVQPKPRFSPPECDCPSEGWQRHTEACNEFRQACYRKWDETHYRPWQGTCEAIPQPLTALVEVKQSRSDFARDHKFKAESPPANICYLAMPRGLIKPDELPAGWHVLEYSDERLSLTRKGRIYSVPLDQQLKTILAIAVRRDHATRFARNSAMMKAERVRLAENQIAPRVRSCMNAMLQIVKGEGKTLDNVLSWHRIKLRPNDYLRGELLNLWGIGRQKENVDDKS